MKRIVSYTILGFLFLTFLLGMHITINPIMPGYILELIYIAYMVGAVYNLLTSIIFLIKFKVLYTSYYGTLVYITKIAQEKKKIHKIVISTIGDSLFLVAACLAWPGILLRDAAVSILYNIILRDPISPPDLSLDDGGELKKEKFKRLRFGEQFKARMSDFSSRILPNVLEAEMYVISNIISFTFFVFLVCISYFLTAAIGFPVSKDMKIYFITFVIYANVLLGAFLLMPVDLATRLRIQPLPPIACLIVIAASLFLILLLSWTAISASNQVPDWHFLTRQLSQFLHLHSIFGILSLKKVSTEDIFTAISAILFSLVILRIVKNPGKLKRTTDDFAVMAAKYASIGKFEHALFWIDNVKTDTSTSLAAKFFIYAAVGDVKISNQFFKKMMMLNASPGLSMSQADIDYISVGYLCSQPSISGELIFDRLSRIGKVTKEPLRFTSLLISMSALNKLENRDCEILIQKYCQAEIVTLYISLFSLFRNREISRVVEFISESSTNSYSSRETVTLYIIILMIALRDHRTPQSLSRSLVEWTEAYGPKMDAELDTLLKTLSISELFALRSLFLPILVGKPYFLEQGPILLLEAMVAQLDKKIGKSGFGRMLLGVLDKMATQLKAE